MSNCVIDIVCKIFFCCVILIKEHFMGFFSKIKNLFLSTITVSPKMMDEFVYAHTYKRVKYKVNKHLEVPVDWCAVFVCGEKVCDILTMGEYTLNFNCIPNTFNKNKMDKILKNGRTKKKFSCDIYFVNMKKFRDIEFITGRKFVIKTADFGKVKGYLEGSLTMRMLDIETFFKLILMEVAYIKNGYAQKFVMGLVGDTINAFMHTSKMDFSSMLTNHRQFVATLSEYVAPRLEECGIEISNLEISSIDLPKKTQLLVNDYIAQHKESDIAMTQFDMLIPAQHDVVQELDDKVASSIQNYSSEEVINQPTFESENKDTGADDIVLRRRSNSVDTVQTDSSYNVSKVDVGQAFSNTENQKKQCKYCDQMIPVESKFCPFCGFRQE